MPALYIREARVTDATAACEVLRRSISELCESDHRNDVQLLAGWLANKTPENVTTWIADPGSLVYVAIDAGVIVGVAAMTRSGVVTLNYVSPDARFKGVSKALLAHLESKAGELGLTRCRLSSTETARRFYRAAGYCELQNSEAKLGIPMAKDIR